MPSITGTGPGAERDRPTLPGGRFVLLRHDCAGSHFDLMLERDGTLATWAVDGLPGPTPRIAHELPSHRIEYLTYEGEISGGRGFVIRIDRGEYESEEWTAESRVVRLSGDHVEGFLTLIRIPAEDGPRGPAWLISFQSDR